MRQGMMMAAAQRRGSACQDTSIHSGRRPSQPPLGLGEESQRRKSRHSNGKVAPAQGEEDYTPRSVSPDSSKLSRSTEASSNTSTPARHSRVGSPQPREPGLAGASGDRPVLGAIGRKPSVQFAAGRPAVEAAPAEDAAWVGKKVQSWRAP